MIVLKTINFPHKPPPFFVRIMEEYIPLLLASGDLPVQHTLFSFYENEVYKMDRLKIPQI